MSENVKHSFEVGSNDQKSLKKKVLKKGTYKLKSIKKESKNSKIWHKKKVTKKFRNHSKKEMLLKKY